ncbi:MAG: DNA-processing protein DprA [Ruminococcus sp.]|nr:DNA-processing protein DprA [Ruminococcus sp.]
MEKTVYKLWRALLCRRLSKSGLRAIEPYDDAEELYLDRHRATMQMSPKDAQLTMSCDLAEAQRQAGYAASAGIRVLFPDSAGYPQRFAGLAAPPPVLFVKGSLDHLGTCCAVVGARDAGAYAFELTRKLSSGLAAAGVTVISGFAVGIDRAGHLGALDVSGQTVAVLGCGILYDYPRGSMQLKEDIARRGAVISEFMPTEKPEPGNFLYRNRLTAALCDCVLCTQAAKRSGSLNTAGLALEAGKPVFVTPPHDLLSGSCDGMISLLRDGASQIYSAQDILSVLGGS